MEQLLPDQKCLAQTNIAYVQQKKYHLIETLSKILLKN